MASIQNLITWPLASVAVKDFAIQNQLLINEYCDLIIWLE